MITVKRVLVKLDPTGTFTVTVQALAADGGYIVGHSGGVPTARVGKEVDRITGSLDRLQNHVSLVYEADEKKTK